MITSENLSKNKKLVREHKIAEPQSEPSSGQLTERQLDQKGRKSPLTHQNNDMIQSPSKR